MRPCAQRSRASEDEAVDVGGARTASDRDVRLRLYWTLRDQRRVCGQGSAAERRADGARLRRHQNVRRTRHGRRHRRADGLRSGKGSGVRNARREPSLRHVDDAPRIATRRLSAWLRLSVHHALRAAIFAFGRRRCARRRRSRCRVVTDLPARPDSVAQPGLPYPRSWSFAALLAAPAMLGPFAIDMYLPAFHAIALEFAVSQIAVQQTLSTYLFAYAFVMLWHGALSDALGRRPVVLVSLAIYAFASLSCAIAGDIQSLWLFRTLQGLSAGAGLVVGRAIIRDRYHWPEAQRLMSQITLVFGIAPALAPVVGGVLLNALGWRAIFWMMLVLVGAV